MGYLLLGGVISVGASAADLLPPAGIPFPAAGHLWTTVYMYFWMQVIQRSRLLDLKELLGRGLGLVDRGGAALGVEQVGERQREGSL